MKNMFMSKHTISTFWRSNVSKTYVSQSLACGLCALDAAIHSAKICCALLEAPGVSQDENLVRLWLRMDQSAELTTTAAELVAVKAAASVDGPKMLESAI